MNKQFDRRLHPIKSDLAAQSYKDKVERPSYALPSLKQINTELVDLRQSPDVTTGIDTQLIYGEQIDIYEQTNDGWSWGQSKEDGYVGWLPTAALAAPSTPSHKVCTLRSYVYPLADLKSPVNRLLSMGAKVTVIGYETTRGLNYAKLSTGGFMVASHLARCDEYVTDWVATAEKLLGTPYLWGGRSAIGLDCSGLVQLSAATAGYQLQRDADMQEATAGNHLGNLEAKSQLQRGDLLFWKGHVAIMSDSNTIIHANGHTMTVAYENLDAALNRIAQNEFGNLTSIRRL
ncbi:NlpC/P60 family protein [Polycladidibacter stylochi]|uniref:C40 family peptidase n=1 Tax=Polycladidibacter stylochi TaxID=1807766 RepID=UPI000829F9E7|nr:NlpC/P60 family protein [Pseudovibrio stylochi]